jgi:ferredoxin
VLFSGDLDLSASFPPGNGPAPDIFIVHRVHRMSIRRILMTKVLIERDECISCGTCQDICPEFFELSPSDNLSTVTPPYRVNDKIDEGDAPLEMRECVDDAAEACPVQVIHVG